MAALSLHTYLENCVAEVSQCHFPPWYEHTTLITLGLGSRALVDDQNCVLHVPVHEIKLEVGATGHPTWTYLHRAVDGHVHPRKCHPILPHQREGQCRRYRPDPYQTDVMGM